MLQLAMKCSSHGVAVEAARRLPQQLEVKEARTLLSTAAARQHVEAVLVMISQQAVQEHIDAVTLEELLAHLCSSDSCVEALLKLRAAAELQDQAALRLLNAAVKQSSVYATKKFSAMPAARQMSSESVVQLLRSVVESNKSAGYAGIGRTCADVLCKLPAAVQLSCDAVADLLQQALRHGAHAIIRASSHLPATQQLREDAAAQLLHTAIASDHYSNMTLLQVVPAVNALLSRAGVVEELLQEAVEQGASYSLFDLLRINTSVADHLGSREVKELLQTAIDLGSDACGVSLCMLPGAKAISNMDLWQLQNEAEDNGCYKCFASLQRIYSGGKEWKRVVQCWIALFVPCMAVCVLRLSRRCGSTHWRLVESSTSDVPSRVAEPTDQLNWHSWADRAWAQEVPLLHTFITSAAQGLPTVRLGLSSTGYIFQYAI
jgi:hypothetical protein